MRIWDIRLSRYTIVLDACVLYPAPLRDLLIELACTDLFRAKWTDQIQREWIEALLKKRPDLEESALRSTAEYMERAVLDCKVENYETLIESIELPDANDRHVLAAAIRSGADAIVTFNLKDFPLERLAEYDMEVLHPDDFLFFQFELSEATVITAVQRIRRRLKKPTVEASDYLQKLQLQGLPKTVAALEPFAQIL